MVGGAGQVKVRVEEVFEGGEQVKWLVGGAGQVEVRVEEVFEGKVEQVNSTLHIQELLMREQQLQQMLLLLMQQLLMLMLLMQLLMLLVAVADRPHSRCNIHAFSLVYGWHPWLLVALVQMLFPNLCPLFFVFVVALVSDLSSISVYRVVGAPLCAS